LNLYIAIIVTLAGIIWFVLAQRRPDQPVLLPATDSTPQVAGQSSAALTSGRASRSGQHHP